jgi:hypothetical protein
VLWHILCLPVAHKSFCAVLWHILCRRSCGTFCAFPGPALAHKPKSLFVPCYGTFCAFPWHISLKVFLCRAVAHFVPSRGTWYSVPSCNCKSRIASQELQVKNCKSRIASQELQKSILDRQFASLDMFFSQLNEWNNFQSCLCIVWGGVGVWGISESKNYIPSGCS